MDTTTPAVVKPDILVDESLAAHVAEIRRLGKRLITDVIEIGRHLTECQDIVGHGNWQLFLAQEFGWSATTALNFMRVFALSKTKSTNFADLALPVSSLYLLAAPSTPEEAVNEIIERAAAGEPVSGDEVKEVIAKAKDIGAGSPDPDAAAAARKQNGAAPDATESQEPADDAAKSAEARKEFYAGADTGDGEHAGDEDDHHHHRVGGDEHVEEPEPTPLKANLETLSAVWEMSTPEEQQGIRDRVLADFFAQAAGAHIAALIPPPKYADVVRPLLDQLGVDGMLQAMSLEFGQRLRAKLPRTAKPFKVTAVKTGKATYTLKGRGSRSLAH